MASILKPKRTSTPGKVPTTSDLADGEMGVNIVDKKVYLRDGASIVEVANADSGGGGGGGVLATVTITASTSLSKATHGNRLIIVNSASTVNLTIGTDSAAGWGDGDFINAFALGAGNVNFTTTGITARKASVYTLTLRAQYCFAFGYRIGVDEWGFGGELVV